MAGTGPILKVGLTGGIASGKSTVAGFLAELGAFVVDADRVAHELMNAGGSAHADVVARFGRQIVRPDGQVDRPALGRLVFSDATARADLDAIVHPRVLEEFERRLERYRRDGHAPIAVLDAALLVESGARARLDRLIVVRCSRESQIRRLLARGGMTSDDATARIDAQAPLEDKLAAADYVIDTDTTLRETRRQTRGVWAALLKDLEP